MSARAASVFLPGFAAAALAGAMALQVARDGAYPRDTRTAETLLYVRSGTALQRLALEFDALASDLYWIRAIQHFGRERLTAARQRTYELLYPLLDITTSLDPYFTIAYRFGAIFLSEAYPGGPGRPDQAIALLEKGIAAQPQKWEYYHDIAFIHYWHFRDYKVAASWFQRAAALPGSPNWLHPLAAAMLNAGGDRASARVIFTQLLQSEEPWLRRTAIWRLQQLDALDQVDYLQHIVRRNPPPPGQPYSWASLVRRRVLPGIPADPAGARYVLDPASGTVSVAPESALQPMPREALQRLPPR
jgi:tetratricopeptide (TPR) repeat protein